MNHKYGFSLIEIIVCLGIIAILAVILLPGYHGFSDSTACKNAANLLYHDLLGQRQRAYALSLDAGITVNGDTYTLWENCYADSIPAPACAIAGGFISKRHLLPLSIAQMTLGFISDGEAWADESLAPLPSPSPSKTISFGDLFPEKSIEIQGPLGSTSFTVTFSPLRTDGFGNWAFCKASPTGDIIIVCAVETEKITIQPNGDVLLR